MDTAEITDLTEIHRLLAVLRDEEVTFLCIFIRPLLKIIYTDRHMYMVTV